MNDKMPKRSYALVAMLDDSVMSPKPPTTVQDAKGHSESQVRAMCFLAGARSLVDQLIAQMEEELQDDLSSGPTDAEGVPDGSWGGLATVFGPDGDIRKFLASLRVASRKPEQGVGDGGGSGG